MSKISSLNRRKFLEYSVYGSAAFWINSVAATPLGSILGNSFSEIPGDKKINSTCNQCYLGCGIIATVRDNKVIHLRGNPDAPTNLGKICPKAHAGVYKLYHPERIVYPLMRVGKRGEGKWKRVSWDFALEFIAEKLKANMAQFGGESMTVLQNVDNMHSHIPKRFTYALGSPNYFDHPASPGAAIGAGIALGEVMVYPDYKNAETIVVIGSNPLGVKDLCYSAREIIEAKHNGTKLITIDPRMTETAMHSSKGLWLPIRPGTDGILLAGFCNYLIENNKYDIEFVKKYTYGFSNLKAYLKKYTPREVCIRTDIPEKQFYKAINAMIGKKVATEALSGVSYQPDAAYIGHMRIVLSALLGCIDTKGGLIPLPVHRIHLPDIEPKVNCPSVGRIDQGNFGKIPLPFLPTPKNLSFVGIGQNLPKHILSENPYKIKSLILCYTNPLYSLNNTKEWIKAIKKLDLLVTIDAFMSESASYADIVLPGTTYLEEIEINDMFPPYKGVVMRKPVVKPKMESKNAQDALILIAQKLGYNREFPMKSYEDYLKQIIENSVLNFNELYDKGYQDIGYKVGETLEKGLLTSSGKIELFSATLAFSGVPALVNFKAWEYPKGNHSNYPLHLISYRVPYHANSRTASNPYLSAIQNENHLMLNSSKAKVLNIETGDNVKIISKAGEVITKAFVTEGIHPDTVGLAHGFGHKAYSKICKDKGVRYNDLVPDETDPISFNITFNTFVRVEKVNA